MQDLVSAIVAKLGVTPAQAQGGASAIFNAARDRIGAPQFEQLLGQLPGVQILLSQAPPGGGGMLGGFASMASRFGAGDMAQAAKLLATFSALGLSKDTALKFPPVVLEYVEAHGGPELVAKLRAALKL